MTAATMSKPPITTDADDIEKETVIIGRVVDLSGCPVGGVSVLLLDDAREFAAELIASPTGTFRFFAAPGTWTLRALSSAHEGSVTVAPRGAGIHEVEIILDFPRGFAQRR